MRILSKLKLFRLDHYSNVQSLVTVEKMVEFVLPVLCISLVGGFVPDEGAFDVAVGGHRPEAQSYL